MSMTSVQLFSVRDAISQDLSGAVARLAAIGFTQVEPYAFHLRTDEFRRAFDAAGVTAPSGHAPVVGSEEPEVIFDAALELGITTVIDPLIPAEFWQTEKQVAELADRVNRLSVLAVERGLKFGYHNHAWELSAHINGRHALEVFVDHLDPQVVLEIDTYWSTVGGADTPALLRSLGDRVRLIHVKDGALDGDTLKQQPAGSGDVDVRSALTAAPRAIRVVEFDDYAGDVFDGVARSLAWLAEHDR